MGFIDKFGGALIGAAGSVLNGIGNVVATNRANKSNQQIAQMTNESNERINQSQIDYNWQMWHAQNEYNNPAAQRQRLVDAGLNPIYYGLDGNSAASGNAFTPIANQQAAPTIPQNFDAFGDAALRMAQIKNLEADSDLKRSGSDLNIQNAETIRQLRSGQLTLQGQQIQLNFDQHDLNGAKKKEILASVDSLRQSIDESDQRIKDLQSQMSKREFDKFLQKAQYEVDKKYKEGVISIQERNLALGWFDAFTSRLNANTNYYNAETGRMSANTQAFESMQLLPSKRQLNESISHFNEANAHYMRGHDRREQGRFDLEQISRAADAYKSAVESSFISPLTFGLDKKYLDGSQFRSNGSSASW